MSMFDFPNWKTPRRRGRRVTETISVLTSDVMRLESRTMLNGMPVMSCGTTMIDAEGNPGQLTNINIVISLDHAGTTEVTADFATQDVTALSFPAEENGFHEDFMPLSGTVSIGIGETSDTITVLYNGDNLIEGTESFELMLTNPVGAEFSGGVSTLNCTVTVADDEDPNAPALSVSNQSVVEGNKKSQNMQVVVSVSPPNPTQDIPFFFFTPDKTAKDQKDYESKFGNATIPAGQTSTTVEIPIIGDKAAEPEETFLFVIDSVTNANVLDPVATITIIDNDSGGGSGGQPTIVIEAESASTQEGNNGETMLKFPFTLSNAPTTDLTIAISSKDGSAMLGEDFETIPTNLVIPAGATSETLTVTVLGDTKHEANETFSLKLSVPKGSGAQLDSKKLVGTILNDDAFPSLILPTLVIASETDGMAQIPVSLTNPTDESIRLKFALFSGTATSKEDFEAKAPKFTMPPGITAGSFSIAIIDDSIREAETETFGLTLNDSTFGTRTVTISIEDND